MSVLWIILPLALLFAGVAIGVFFWAVRAGQFEDMKTPALRVLVDEEEKGSDPFSKKGSDPFSSTDKG